MTVRSMYSGVSGLRATANNIDVIGNNIANVNTVGYRKARLTTADLFSQTLSGATGATATRGGTNPVQIGLGVKTDTIDTIFTQGNTQETERLLDLSINGSGFFMLSDGEGGSYYTRAGNFSLDELGYVTQSSTGYRLIGQIANAQGVIDSSKPAQQIQVDYNSLSDAVPTETATLGGNLSSDTESEAATSLNTLVTLFNEDGVPLGLNAGDTIRITGGTYDTVPAGTTVTIPSTDVLSITSTTTLGELVSSLRTQLRSLTGSTSLDVAVDSTGAIRFETGSETLTNLSISAYDVDGSEKTSVRALFNDGEIDGNIDILANSSASTETIRQADATTSTEVFDSQGNALTVVATFAKNTSNVSAVSDTLLTSIYDDADRNLGLTAGTTSIVLAAGSVIGATTLATDISLVAVTGTSTLEDLRSALQTQLNTTAGTTDITVTLQSDGSFSISSPTATISNMRIQTDNDAVNGGTASAAGVITRLFTNQGYGIEAATDGLDVTAGSTVETNSFHTASTLVNSWNYQVVVPHAQNLPPSATTGQLVFLSNGNFESYGSDSSGDALVSNPVIQFDPDGTDPENGGVDSLTIMFDFSDMTQNSASTTASIISQDGSTVGQLESVEIGTDGVVTGVFSNGTTRALAQILVATFSNEGGLLRSGNNLFTESANSGEAVLNTAGTLAAGEIMSGELELSNVDISEEFVNLIIAQRAFQANARVITTGDTILQELVNLIR